jgi:hypothetical protein
MSLFRTVKCLEFKHIEFSGPSFYGDDPHRPRPDCNLRKLLNSGSVGTCINVMGSQKYIYPCSRGFNLGHHMIGIFWFNPLLL